MSTYSASDGVAVEGSRGASIGDWLKSSGTGVAAAIAWVAFGLSCLWWPDIGDWSRTYALGIAAFVVAAFALFGTLSADFLGSAGPALRRRTPWLVALGLFLTVWELATAKFGWLPLPFFPPPQSILEVYTDDLPKLLDSVFASVKLQLGGYIIGATVGFLTGVSIGWSRSVGYWVHPVLRFIGPLPATAWLPIAFFIFPVELERQHLPDRAGDRLPRHRADLVGRRQREQRLLRRRAHARRQAVASSCCKVAIPAALPHVFVGLFMGLGASFAVLVVAEMMGVKAGLGWYLQWAQGWAAYANMYAALIVMSLLCSGVITLLFRMRDRLLVWQKGSRQMVALPPRRRSQSCRRRRTRYRACQPRIRYRRRRAAGAGRHQSLDRAGRVRRPARTDRLRQVDLAAAGRRTGSAA